MQITIHYHAFLKDAAGVAAETLELPAAATILDAVRAVARLHPAAAPVLLLRSGDLAPYVKVQHNGRPATGPAELSDGDTLALYPALTGG